MPRVAALFGALLFAFAAHAQSLMGILGDTGGGGGFVAPTYVGQIANRTYMPFGFTTLSGNTLNYEVGEYIYVPTTSLRVAFANVYDSGSGEIITGLGNMTLTASVEYPKGTCHQITFNGGSTSVTLTPGALILADAVSVSVPSPDFVGIRAYVSGTTALSWADGTTQRQEIASLGGNRWDYVETPGANSDKTVSCASITDGGGNIAMYPFAIVGNTNQPTICNIGSSRSVGFQDTGGYDSKGNAGYTRFYGQSFAYMDHSTTGVQFTVEAGIKGTLRYGMTRSYCTHFHLDPGLNDLHTASVTAAQLMAVINGFIPTWPNGASSMFTNLEAGWTTGTCSTQATIAMEPQRVLLNSSLSAMSGTFNQIIDPTSLVGWSTNNSLWRCIGDGNGDLVNYTPDFIHETTAGLQAEVAANLFNPSLIQQGLTAKPFSMPTFFSGVTPLTPSSAGGDVTPGTSVHTIQSVLYPGYWTYHGGINASYVAATTNIAATGMTGSGYTGIMGAYVVTTGMPVVGFQLSTTPNGTTNIYNGLYCQTGSGWPLPSAVYKPLNNGGLGVPTQTINCQTGDITRVRRDFAGSKTYAEVSQDNGNTWTSIYTWCASGCQSTNYSAATLYAATESPTSTLSSGANNSAGVSAWFKSGF